ncbi:MAG: GNAT family N-acetyltransferase [Armatimonadetes bacterium]|nr:GNAT family N-acetyltransferase [Armatimonadota bacterium]
MESLETLYARFPELSTPRLRLRETRPEDAPAILDILSRPEVVRFYDVGPLTRLEEAQEIVARRARDFARHQRIRWTIARREDDLAIGSCGVSKWTPGDPQAEVGYELSPDHQGQGLMREALTAVLAFGFGAMRLSRVEALVVPENAPSRRLLARLGFQEKELLRGRGFWRGASHDLLLLSLVAEAWNDAAGTPYE